MDHDARQLERERVKLSPGKIVVQRKAHPRYSTVGVGTITQREGGVAQLLAVQRVHGYQLVGDYGIQRYDERYKGVDRTAESVLEFYLPVRPTPETE